jgi:hypothetical protein
LGVRRLSRNWEGRAMPRFRFTVRGMLLGVAIAAVCVCTYELRNRSSAYHERASEYRRLQALYKDGSLDLAVDADASRRFGELGDKYDRAARCPWWPVAPDPDSEVQRRVRLERFLEYLAASRDKLPDAPKPK